jgi:hypothetical protein
MTHHFIIYLAQRQWSKLFGVLSSHFPQPEESKFNIKKQQVITSLNVDYFSRSVQRRFWGFLSKKVAGMAGCLRVGEMLRFETPFGDRTKTSNFTVFVFHALTNPHIFSFVCRFPSRRHFHFSSSHRSTLL